MKTAIEMIEGMRYKLRMFGILVDGETNVFCDNEAVVHNLTKPESTLKKKHIAISYHRAREAPSRWYHSNRQGTDGNEPGGRPYKMYAGTTAKVHLWPRLILRNSLKTPMHAVQNGWHVYPLKQWLKIDRPLDNCTLYLGDLDSDATKTSSRRLTKLGHNRAVARTAVGDRWRVTLKRTVKRRIVVIVG